MKTLVYEDLSISIRESARRKTLELTIERDGSVTLAAPPDVPRADLLAFVEDNSLWLYTKLAEKERQARARPPQEYLQGAGFFYLGRSYRLKLVPATVQRVPLRLHQGRFCLREDRIPYGREHFIAWYTLHLRPHLDRYLAVYADRVGRRPTETHIQDLGFRWGSANRRGHLYFHWRVALLPSEMIEYVVAHELAHLVERYHSPAFWERLERVMPDYAARKRWLAEEGGAYDV